MARIVLTISKVCATCRTVLTTSKVCATCQTVLTTSKVCATCQTVLATGKVCATCRTVLITSRVGGSLVVVRSYALGYEPLVTGYLAMGLTIHSSHKQELSSVYQFIDVLYSHCIYEALRH